MPGSLPEAQLRIFTSDQNRASARFELRLIDVKNARIIFFIFQKYHNISESSRKNAFGPIGRREHAKLARELFLLSKKSEMVYSPISGSEMLKLTS